MMNARQMCETMNKREDVAKAYCKKKGWNKLTLERFKEIKQSSEWRKIIPTIMEGY